MGRDSFRKADCVPPEPPKDCALCPRLRAFREEWAAREPSWRNAPIPSFGEDAAALLILGLAPGLRGANRTGRPFTGDFTGDLLYPVMKEFGFARGEYATDGEDDLQLVGAMISNAVRCVPPKNKPSAAEINACRPFLLSRIEALAGLRALLCLGRVAHDSAIRTLGASLKAHPFRHGARHRVSFGGREFSVFDSYHCSRYNTNTGVLTPEMFRAVFSAIRQEIGEE